MKARLYAIIAMLSLITSIAVFAVSINSPSQASLPAQEDVEFPPLPPAEELQASAIATLAPTLKEMQNKLKNQYESGELPVIKVEDIDVLTLDGGVIVLGDEFYSVGYVSGGTCAHGLGIPCPETPYWALVSTDGSLAPEDGGAEFYIAKHSGNAWASRALPLETQLQILEKYAAIIEQLPGEVLDPAILPEVK